jgi:hypothetical protein
MQVGEMRILPLVVGMALAAVSSAGAEDLPFTPSQIRRLIDSGVAPGRGAGFATTRYGSGVVSNTHLWQESADHQVFFITRNGISYGEYREQTLAKATRFAELKECYLVAEARTADYLREATTLPFVRRKTTHEWSDKTWTGSIVAWSFLWCDRHGKIVRHGESQKQQLVRRLLEIRVPENLTTPARDDKLSGYYIDVHRLRPTKFEQAFGNDWQSKATAKLKDGRCSIWINCPTDARDLVFDLFEVAPPRDQRNALLTVRRDVGSMTASIDSLKDELVFKPD